MPPECPDDVKMSLEVFLEPNGLCDTIVEYIAPIYIQIDEIGLLFPSDVVVPRQHIHDVLVSEGGDKEKAIAVLQQYYPLLRVDASSTAQPLPTTTTTTTTTSSSHASSIYMPPPNYNNFHQNQQCPPPPQQQQQQVSE